ncbi:hypothetical protein [Aequorivita antarctica]|uniref:Outer membrane protein beta-barrel domain-containing protein n=1 Tax=Aequorivita antarctica TaxID=153266 RepID=A0A5C6Z2W4_9FLAO|nr:hypothetical protein [Aequorivita antarctica]TXD74511.1 hypothetical protein ESU54_04465 [Aequorivita antarctica]SRX73872.1 hypothetical protein AEQU3_01307 [Aequorivita antarctica]
MKNLIFITVIALFAQNSFAQESVVSPKNSAGFIISFGASFPMADFGNPDLEWSYHKNKNLGGGTGIALNIDYVLPLADNGIGLFVGAGFNYNGLKRDYKRKYQEETRFYAGDITYQNYYSIPVSTGINFTHNFDETFGLFGNLGIVVNFLKIKDREVNTPSQNITASFDAKTGIGLRLGGGIIFKSKYYFSLNYINVGKTKIKFTEEIKREFPNPSNQQYDFTDESKISYLNLTVGIKL